MCGETNDDNNQYVIYKIINNANKIVGQMTVHRAAQCFTEGSKLLQTQYTQVVNASHIESINHIGNKKYTFRLIQEKDYFVMPLYDILHDKRGAKYKLNKDTYKFLQDFVEQNTLILVFMQALQGTSEAHIPLLASIHDPNIPQGLLANTEYITRKTNAINQMKTSMDVRGKDNLQTIQIMYKYVQDTAILI